MLSLSPSTPKKALRWILAGVFVGGLVALSVQLHLGQSLVGHLVRTQTEGAKWFVLDQGDVFSGATIPPDTNVVFHLPLNFQSIDREVLLGQKGESTRYWGYCFPQNYDPKLVNTRTGFPGQMFLSEKERKERNLQVAANAPQFSLQNLPSKRQLERLQDKSSGTIRHQIEVFQPGMLCYIMTEGPLTIGLDLDGDGLNSQLESEIGTDPENPDTDGDGLIDSVEYLNNTSPLLRDTDGDGIIDGIEDKNWNGRVSNDETDPRVKDTDRDGLCDGMCRMRLSNGQLMYAGEDKNLNGVVDSGETSPLLIDSKKDGYGDYQRFLKCIMAGHTDC